MRNKLLKNKGLMLIRANQLFRGTSIAHTCQEDNGSRQIGKSGKQACT